MARLANIRWHTGVPEKCLGNCHQKPMEATVSIFETHGHFKLIPHHQIANRFLFRLRGYILHPKGPWNRSLNQKSIFFPKKWTFFCHKNTLVRYVAPGCFTSGSWAPAPPPNPQVLEKQLVPTSDASRRLGPGRPRRLDLGWNPTKTKGETTWKNLEKEKHLSNHQCWDSIICFRKCQESISYALRQHFQWILCNLKNLGPGTFPAEFFTKTKTSKKPILTTCERPRAFWKNIVV